MTSRSSSSAAASISARHVLGRLAEAAEHVGGDDLRVGRVGAPHPHADAPEVGAAELAVERLQAVVARQASPQTRLDTAERQVDLVVHGDHVVEVHAELATGRAHRAARLVHEGLRQQHGHPRPARAGPAAGDQARRTSSSPRGSPQRSPPGSPPRSPRCGASGRTSRRDCRDRRSASRLCHRPCRGGTAPSGGATRRRSRRRPSPRTGPPRPRRAPRPPRPRAPRSARRPRRSAPSLPRSRAPRPWSARPPRRW